MSAALIPEGLEPVAAWDVDTAWPETWTEGHIAQANWWMIHHLGLYAIDVDRVEFYVLDGPFAVVHAFTRIGPLRSMPPPVVVPLDELPPVHLLKC